MFEDVIRNFYILLFAIYSFYKLLNITPKNSYTHFALILSTAITSFFSAFFFNRLLSTNWLFILLMFFILMILFSKLSITTTYITVLFAFSLSFITFSFCAIATGYILFPFYNKTYDIPWLAIRLLAGLLHFALIYFCFRIPRLKRGMKFLYYIPSNNIASSICIVSIMLLIMFCQSKRSIELYTLKCTAVTLLFSFLLIYWWNYHLTQTYRKLAKKSELDSLNLLLEERNQQILYLREENDKLAGLIHKDNKLIPALSMAIIDSYENKTAPDLSAMETDSPLLIQLKQLYEERTKFLNDYRREASHLPQTAFDSVNAVLSYMQSEALRNHIPYEVVLFDSLTSTIPAEITEKDFTHILSDLLSNAVNACKDIPSASIQVYLGKMDGISTIRICNVGTGFAPGVLKNLGLARHTTHADTGGSGIGLMDIWKIKEQYKATLMIDETADSPCTYTSVNILFNHKKHYIVQSDRHKELASLINRPDIMIISKES